MRPVDQEFTHRPEVGQHGDCQRAVIASLLELPIMEALDPEPPALLLAVPEPLAAELPMSDDDVAAVLARYGLTDRLAAVTNLATPLPAARWILVPHRTTSAVPTLDGTSIPLPANGWLTLPNALIRSVTVESGRGPSTALG